MQQSLSNVVTEENFPLLWQEMLHPHLEEERQRGEAAVNRAKADGRKRLDKANEQIEAIKKEKEQSASSQSARLEARRSEDFDAIQAMCTDVEGTLRRIRAVRVVTGVILGLLFSVPLIMDTTPIVRGVSFVIGWLLAYLTATGGKLLSIGVEETPSLKALRSTAERRKLLGKLDQFNVSWNKTAFIVEYPPELPTELPTKTGPIDLFTAGKSLR